MNKPIGILLLAGLAVGLFAGTVFAGRGGGSFHGGGSYRGGGSFQGGSSFRGSDSFRGGSPSYGGMNRSAVGHTPSLSTPRPTTRPSSDWSRADRVGPSNSFNRSEMTIKPWTGGGARPETRPGTAWAGARPGTLPARTDWARNNNWNHHDWYHGNWHGNWDHPWNRWPNGWFGAGVAWGLAAATPWSWGYWPYYNPYYVTPIVTDGATIDYSQPILAAAPPEQPADQGPPADQSSQLLDAARDAFAQGDYAAALRQVDQAIAQQPGDPAAHEFRSLICFAMKNYKEAAAGAYAVLSAGPGWDWTTLSGFYPDVDVYTQQLRALEQYVDTHRDVADARFLLAYQYLTCGYNDAAARQLKAVVELNPKDRLSAELLASLSAPATPESAEPATPATPPKPVDAASLVGNWTAQQPDGSSVGLKITPDSKYTWQYTRQGKTEQHNGTYTVADNLLILKQGNTPAMIGQVATLGGNRFNFKLANDNPSDPGLTFNK